MIVSLQTDIAITRQFVFEVELTNERLLLQRCIFITKITIEEQPVIEQLTGKQHFHLCFTNTPILAGTDIRPDLHLICNRIEQRG